MSNHFNYLLYGTKSSADEVKRFISHTIESNQKNEAEGKRKTPLCIWGKHGIGKTQLVEDFARENEYEFVYIAPAQFEEMGDLIGMPSIIDNKTVFVAPEWVPKGKGPGILLIDDANRADDRILRGIMQLLQNHELVSWKLPEQWNIILTANPDGGDYSVTPMDDAMLTRLLHITMEFDVKEWSKWAENNKIDQRGINFVLTYPEIVTGNRTTPRSLVQFFEQIASIEHLDEELGLVQMLADACLDSNTVATFMSFVNNNLSKLITPEELINADDFKTQVLDHLQGIVMSGNGPLRVDIIATLCTRLVNYLTINNIDLDTVQLNNIKSFIKIDFIPNDIRLSLAQDLVVSPKLKVIMADPEIGNLLLSRM